MKKFIRTKFVAPLLALLLIFNSTTIVNAATYSNDNWSSSDWTTYWQGPAEKTSDGIKIIINATYNHALNSDYYDFDFKTGNLMDNGSWLMFGFENALVDIDSGVASKIRFYLRNNGGKLNVYGENVTKNQNLVNFMILNDVNAIGDIHVIFAKDTETNQWYISINGNRFDGGNFNNITTSDFCDGTGNTHLGFASWSETPPEMTREDALNYTIKSVSTDRPAVYVPDYLEPTNWTTYWQGPAEKTSDGIKIITNATCNQALNSDYYDFDFKTGNLMDNGSWLMFGFENALVDIDGGAASKIRFSLRNNGGKLNVYGVNVTKNQNLVNFIILNNVNAVGDIHVIFAKDTATNQWYLSINGNRFDGGNFNNITTSDFCDGNGGTYLGFASWSDVPEGMTREDALNYTIESVSTDRPVIYVPDYLKSANWTTYWQGPAEKTSVGIKITTNATNNQALNSDYFAFNFKIGSLIDNGSWLMFGFENALVDMDGGAASKIRFFLRNNGGKINIYGENVTKNQNLVDFMILDTVNAVGDIHGIFAKDLETNKWYLSINGVRLVGGNFDNITTSDFCDGNGSTYLGFASWSDVPEGMTREAALNYTITTIVPERPGTNVNDIDTTTLYQQENSQYLSAINNDIDGVLYNQSFGESVHSVKFTNEAVVNGSQKFTSLSNNVKGNRYSLWIKSDKHGLVTVNDGMTNVVNLFVDSNVWTKVSFNNTNASMYSLGFDTKSDNTQAVTLYVDRYVEVVPANFNNYTLLENSLIKLSANTNKLDFISSVDTIVGASLSTYDNNGDLLSDNALIGTGNIVKVSDIQDVSYQVVVLGDVDGNGKIDLEDLVSIRDDLLEVSPLEGIYEKAGDLYGEKDITLNDLVGIMSCVSHAENSN